MPRKSKNKKSKTKSEPLPRIPPGSVPAPSEYKPNTQPILRAQGEESVKLMGGSTPVSPSSMKGKALLGRGGNLTDKAAFKKGPVACKEK